MLRIALNAFVFFAGACVILGFGYEVWIASNHPPPSHNQSDSANNRRQSDEGGARYSAPSDSVFIEGLNEVAKYCAGKPDGEPDKWLHNKFLCDLKATDVVVALCTSLLMVLTAALAFFTCMLWTGSERTSKRQLRAYIFPNDVAIMSGETVEPPQPLRNGIPFTAMSIVNFGATPAYRVVHWADLKVLDPLHEDDLVIPKIDEKFSAVAGAGGRLLKNGWHRRALTEDEIKAVNEMRASIYLYGRVEYRDIYNRKWRTDYRLRYDGPFPPPKDVIFRHCQNGNSAT
jgi:hypothetical protein